MKSLYDQIYEAALDTLNERDRENDFDPQKLMILVGRLANVAEMAEDAEKIINRLIRIHEPSNPMEYVGTTKALARLKELLK